MVFRGINIIKSLQINICRLRPRLNDEMNTKQECWIFINESWWTSQIYANVYLLQI